MLTLDDSKNILCDLQIPEVFAGVLKKGLRIILEKPSRLFNSDERTIKFQFDLMHGRNNLKKAIEEAGGKVSLK